MTKNVVTIDRNNSVLDAAEAMTQDPDARARTELVLFHSNLKGSHGALLYWIVARR